MRNISKQIENLLLIRADNQHVCCILSDFTLNWIKIKNLFSDSENLEDVSECLRLKRIIDPIIQESNEILHKPREFLEILKIYSEWTCSTGEVLTIFNEFSKNPEKYGLCGFLQLSAIVEYALGNVFQGYFKSQPPHLLKDLLKGLRQCELFDQNQILVLQILLGTSKGVNLRNLSWHGFMEALDPSYLSFLFVIIVSYGKQLQNILIIQKYKRNAKLNIDIKIEKETLHEILSSTTIKNCNFNSWKTIIEFFNKESYKSGVYLLLCQLEHLLRFMYRSVNNENVTAEINKYYVIMDSIFYSYLLNNEMTPLVIGKITKVQETEIKKTHSRNKLLEFFPRSIFYIYYDLFYAADGPRLRDKISHGEMFLDGDCSEKIFLTLLQFSLLIVKYYDHQTFHEKFLYDSIYMSNVLFYKEFIKINNLIDNTFKHLVIPSALKNDKAYQIGFEIIKLEIESDEIKIHFRPFIEAQIVKMLLKIMETFSFSLQNFQESSSDIFRLFEERKLSSSRRLMLENFITFLPNFTKSFISILILMKKTFLTVQKLEDTFDNDHWSKKIIKILKQTLQLTQIYHKHFSIEERNYFVANNKTCEFLSQTVDSNQHMFNYEYLKANVIP